VNAEDSPQRFYLAGSGLDTDGDLLTDAREKYLHHSNPNVADSDGDGMDDGGERFSPNFSPKISW